MSTLKVAGVDPPPMAHDADESTVPVLDGISPTPRIKAAFSALREALEYARDLGGSPWDFAVEISALRRLKLSNNDLRWLAVRGLIEHGIEITRHGGPTRSFRHTKRTRFAKGSCFVLTSAGVDLADEWRRDDEPNENNGPLMPAQRRAHRRVKSDRPRSPEWDRNRLELRVGSDVVRRFTIPSPNQESVLAAFEEELWPAYIDDPLPHCNDPSRQARLHETIDQLNHGQKRPLVLFFSDSGGQTIRWQYRDDAANLPKA